MKRLNFLLLLSFLFLSASSIFSQDVEKKEFNTKKTEVDIAVANIFAKTNWLYSYYFIDGTDLIYDYYYDYIPQPELMLGIKLHSTKGAVRLGTNLQYYNSSSKNENNAADDIKLNNFGFQLNIGYEWELTYNRIVIYYGADLSGAYAARKITQVDYNTTYTSEYNETGVGISPLLGVNCFITPNLSIGTEVKFTAEYVNGKSATSSSSSSTESVSKYKRFMTYFGPLGFLSINIYF